MERLRQRADFVAAATGARAPTAAFVLQARKRGDSGPIRVGFTVTKNVGSAVERNRLRRRLKSVVARVALAQMHPGHDYVLVGRRAALELPFDRLVDDFNGALRRLETTAARAASRRTAPAQPPTDTSHR